MYGVQTWGQNLYKLGTCAPRNYFRLHYVEIRPRILVVCETSQGKIYGILYLKRRLSTKNFRLFFWLSLTTVSLIFQSLILFLQMQAGTEGIETDEQ